jgi:hypothetical protein
MCVCVKLLVQFLVVFCTFCALLHSCYIVFQSAFHDEGDDGGSDRQREVNRATLPGVATKTLRANSDGRNATGTKPSIQKPQSQVFFSYLVIV